MITKFQKSISCLLLVLFASLLFTFGCGKNVSEQRQAAEKLGANWLAAILRKDVDALVQMSDVPFYFDNKVLAQLKDVRANYEKELQIEGFLRENENVDTNQLIKVQTIGELKKQEGYKGQAEKTLSRFNLSDEDFAVIITFDNKRNISFKLFTRTVGGNLKLAGWWD